jgi:hypothetical protein
MSKKLYVMDSCWCLSEKKPKEIIWLRKTYVCSKCGFQSLGYDEW